MPLVLAAGAPTASGLAYDDVVGVRHGFPRRYRSWMLPGTPFVYYRGRRAAALGMPGSVYFGSGVVGDAPDTGSLELSAEIFDFVEFPSPVPLHRPDGSYYETAAARNRRYWLRGVRVIDETVFIAILQAAQAGDEVVTPDVAKKTPPGKYASNKALMDAVERYAVDAVVDALRNEFGAENVEEMPHGNPGFDVLVRRQEGDLHVEVKGTRQASPSFFMSEGERLHSVHQQPNYRLCVVAAIDLVAGTHVLHWHNGPVASPDFGLETRQWHVQLF